MNIFILSTDPNEAAKHLCDQHLRKMLVETAQMLSTAHHELEPDSDVIPLIYKSTHKNHPCNVWIRKHAWNYNWLLQHFFAMHGEYVYRFGKEHASFRLWDHLIYPPLPLRVGDFTRNHPPSDWPRAMPENFKTLPNIHEAYRAYYVSKKFKRGSMTYTKRHIPGWWFAAQRLAKTCGETSFDEPVYKYPPV